jgi:hypothetical protein
MPNLLMINSLFAANIIFNLFPMTFDWMIFAVRGCLTSNSPSPSHQAIQATLHSHDMTGDVTIHQP